ncbi:MAG: hypothetical protein ABIT04_03960 [Novosphingobium sp.]
MSIAIRAASVLAGFLITYYIGHNFGPLANGQYALLTQTAMFLSILAVGGMDMAVVRHFSATLAFKVPLSRSSLRRALGYSLAAAALIVAFLGFTHSYILQLLFSTYMPPHGVMILATLLGVRTTTRLTAAVLRSQGRHLVAQTVEVFSIPGFVTLLLLLGVIESLEEVLYATAAIGVLTAAFAVLHSFLFTSSSKNALDVPLSALFRTSLPLWLTAIALNLADWYSLATAAATLGVYDAGLFRVAFQIGTAMSFSAMGILNVFTAQISAAMAVHDVDRVARLARSVTGLTMGLLLPIVVLLFVGAETLLGFIGPEFRAAAPLLEIFLVGQLVFMAAAPAGLILAMSGHERLNLAISASVTAGLLVLAPLAAHYYGLFGLAVLTACVPVCGSIANVVAVWRLQKINIITGRYFGEPRMRTTASDRAPSAMTAEGL